MLRIIGIVHDEISFLLCRCGYVSTDVLQSKYNKVFQVQNFQHLKNKNKTFCFGSNKKIIFDTELLYIF